LPAVANPDARIVPTIPCADRIEWIVLRPRDVGIEWVS
jgi:hypothetical protein